MARDPRINSFNPDIASNGHCGGLYNDAFSNALDNHWFPFDSTQFFDLEINNPHNSHSDNILSPIHDYAVDMAVPDLTCLWNTTASLHVWSEHHPGGDATWLHISSDSIHHPQGSLVANGFFSLDITRDDPFDFESVFDIEKAIEDGLIESAVNNTPDASCSSIATLTTNEGSLMNAPSAPLPPLPITAIPIRSRPSRTQRRYLCDHCGKDFSRQDVLDRHQLRHDPTAPRYPCPFPDCKRTGSNGFPRRDKLRDHCRQIHHSEL
ncbi:hypothetical protein F5884DRAFT_758246 [Xylogone sp. PMI_703]|nr:hypothetical protein F5884DRAFT_758246 [Xylogone sp. PMI_703]